MSLDILTLYLVAAVAGVMLGGMLLFFGRQQKIPTLNWWGAAYILGAVSIGVWTIAGSLLGDTVALALNAVGFVACGMVWSAARVFHGRKPNWLALPLGAVVWLIVIMCPPDESSATRLTIGASIVAAYAVLTANELWSEQRKAMQRRWPALLVPILHGFVLMFPILLGHMLRADGSRFRSGFWVPIFAFELVLYAVGTVFVIFMLVSDRTVKAHKAAALIDPLTGMLNRRGFAEATARVIERQASAGCLVTVLIFDIDHFKSINDRFGHAAGDEILKLFAIVVTNTLRITDLSGRIGGEEFAALLPCSIKEAACAAERVREAFAASGITVEDAPVETTVSIGVASGPPGAELEVLLAAADTALYQAKRGGRNRIEVAEDESLSLERRRRRSAARPALAAGQSSVMWPV